MAPHSVALQALLFFVLALANLHLSSCQLVKGSVSCLDCDPHHDLSGMRIAVKCRDEKRIGYALTNTKGFFEVKIPRNSPPPPSASPNCVAMLLGGPMQLWAFKKTTMSKIVKANGPKNSYALSTPIKFYTSSPLTNDRRTKMDEKIPAFPPTSFPPLENRTGDLPLIFFFPFIPIIGIP